jgi:hypothetical protein
MSDMGKIKKKSVSSIFIAAVYIAIVLAAGGFVEAADSTSLTSDWAAIISITKLLLWSFMLSLVLLMFTLIGAEVALKPLDMGAVDEVVLIDAVEDFGSMIDTLDRKLLAGNMNRKAHRKVRTFLEGRTRFDRRAPIVRKEAA